MTNVDGEEKSLRYSKQRQVIYEMLKNTKSHPDVDAIYAEVKKTLPDVGIATVYRNLRQLVEAGLVTTLETTKSSIHYDADVSEHIHFICEDCGRIDDFFLDSGLKNAIENSGYELHREKLILYGLCPECRSRKGN